MLDRLFLEHPRSVGETYTQHFGVATGFGLRLIAGGIGCCIHGFLPFAFRTAGSDTVRTLNEVLVRKRDEARAHHGEVATIEYMI